MRHLNNFQNSTFPEALSKLLPRPSNVITVGADNCDYTSLVTALAEGSEGDFFIVYGGTHDGKLILRPNQAIHCIGNVIFKQSANDYLFQFALPVGLDPEMGSGTSFVYFSGASPYLSPYSPTKWFQNPQSTNTPFLSWSGIVELRGLFLDRTFTIYQSGTNAPVIQSTTDDCSPDANFDVTKIAASPIHTRDGLGLYTIQIAPDIPVNCSRYKLHYRFEQIPDRSLTWLQGSDNFIFDIEVVNSSYICVDTWRLQLNYKIPLHFAFL